MSKKIPALQGAAAVPEGTHLGVHRHNEFNWQTRADLRLESKAMPLGASDIIAVRTSEVGLLDSQSLEESLQFVVLGL